MASVEFSALNLYRSQKTKRRKTVSLLVETSLSRDFIKKAKSCIYFAIYFGF